MPYRLIAPLVPLYAGGLERHARRLVLESDTGPDTRADTSAAMRDPAGDGARAARPTLARVLADPRALDRLLDAQARHFRSTDRMVVASVWSLTYFERLIPSVAAAASVLGRVLPVGAAEVVPRWARDGSAWRFVLPHHGTPMAGAPTLHRYAPLLEDHLRPLVEALAIHARLPRAVAWGNAARLLDMTLSRLDQAMPGQPGIALDRQRLLDTATLQGDAPNPLYRQQRYAERGGRRVALLRRCCLYYRLPGHGYCDPCPLAPCNRRPAAVLPD